MPKFEANRAHYLLKWFQSIKDFHHKLNNNLKSLIKVKKYYIDKIINIVVLKKNFIVLI